jgi:hypothetical protein
MRQFFILRMSARVSCPLYLCIDLPSCPKAKRRTANLQTMSTPRVLNLHLFEHTCVYDLRPYVWDYSSHGLTLILHKGGVDCPTISFPPFQTGVVVSLTQ